MYRVKDRAAGALPASGILAVCLVPSASTVLALFDPRLRHWFLIPVTVCGVLIGTDALEWLRGRRDVFDPQAILGLFGLHFYYLAPILHVVLDRWPPLVYPAAEWRHALGVMAALNAAGLGIYRAIVSLPHRSSRPTSVRRLDETTFYRVGLTGAQLGFLAFLVLLAVLGGPDGFLHVMTENRDALVGRGWLLLISEAFPLLFFSLVVVRWRHALRRSGGVVVLLLIALVTVQFAVGGLRGSRSSVLWPLVLGLILVHLLVSEISRKAFFASAAVVVVFVYAYGLYKTAGVEVVDIAKGTRTVEEVSSKTGRDVPTVLLSDLARADMQALVLDRVRSPDIGWSYGSTYVAAPLSLVPRALVAERPRDKAEVGTDLLYGEGTFESGIRSQRVYGLTGEAIINFGPVGGLFSFVFLALFLRFVRRYYARAKASADLAPKLLCPPLCAITVILVTADLDNILAFFVGEALPLVLVVLCALQSGTEARRSPFAFIGTIHPETHVNLQKGNIGSGSGQVEPAVVVGDRGRVLSGRPACRHHGWR